MFINHKMTHRYIYFRFTRHVLQLHHVTMSNYLHGYKRLCCQNLAYHQTEIKWSFFVDHLNSWFAGTHENWYATNKNEFTVYQVVRDQREKTKKVSICSYLGLEGKDQKDQYIQLSGTRGKRPKRSVHCISSYLGLERNDQKGQYSQLSETRGKGPKRLVYTVVWDQKERTKKVSISSYLGLEGKNQKGQYIQLSGTRGKGPKRLVYPDIRAQSSNHFNFSHFILHHLIGKVLNECLDNVLEILNY